jgi:cytosine/adenosine deaminase-related metal-dependent hydrolase
MTVHRAAWVLPIAGAVIRDGWVAVDGDRVAACGNGADVPGGSAAPAPFGEAPFAILPALVNAHTHLELSHMRGMIPPSGSFAEWMTVLVQLRRERTDPEAPQILSAVRDAIAQARDSGTGLVGDISNTLVTVALLGEAGMAGRVFHEVLGFNLPDAAAVVRTGCDRVAAATAGAAVRVNITPHAPYSVSPAMFEEIERVLAEAADAVVSVHLGESPEEIVFLRSGAGGIRTALERIGAWDPGWQAPGCGPVEYMQRFGLLTPRLLAVHGVQFEDDDLARLKSAGGTLVTCPRSNRWTGVGDPDVARFYRSGIRVAVGTDSLASVADLNMFAELARIRTLAPQVPAATILESATRIGAEALGFGKDYGTIEPGKKAALIAVRLPADAVDVEEYLVSGISPADVSWLQ